MVPTVPEGKALVLYGRKMRPGSGSLGFIVMAKGGRSPMPIVETAELMDVGPQKVELDHNDVRVVQGGVDRRARARLSATVRVPDDEQMLALAAEHLLHVNFSDVQRWARTFIEAHLRGLLRDRDIDSVSADMAGFARDLQDLVNMDLMAIGVAVEDLTIPELKLRGE